MLGSMTMRMLNGKEDTGLYLGALAPRLTGRFVGEAAFFISGQENQKMKENIYVKLLKKAKELIESDESIYVCNAVNNAFFDPELTDAGAVARIEKWITECIFPHHTVSSWLLWQGLGGTPVEMRRYRMAWIDQMIPIVAEWEEPCA